MATIRRLQNVSNLFGDILERYTGLREAPDPDKQSAFSIACDELVFLLESQADQIRNDLAPHLDGLPDDTVYDAAPVIGVIRETIEKAVMRNADRFPDAQVETMARFAPVGASAVCILAQRMGHGADPDTFESNREKVILCGSLMARYPAPISANFRQMMQRSTHSVIRTGDISDTFREYCSRMIMGAADINPHMLEKIRRFDACPAKKNVGRFCGLTFDLHATCYRHVWERLSGQCSDAAGVELMLQEAV